MKSFFFGYLRTDRELGYVAAAKIYDILCVSGFVILTQGSKLPPSEINEIIEQGLLEF